MGFFERVSSCVFYQSFCGPLTQSNTVRPRLLVIYFLLSEICDRDKDVTKRRSLFACSGYV